MDCQSPYSSPEMSEDGNYRIKRIKFQESEDQKLINLVQQYGVKCWSFISSQMPGRTPRQCRDRWNHYLAPQTNTTKWTVEEDQIIIKMVKKIGKQWSKIASLFPGRTGIAVRNRCCKLSRQKNADPSLKTILTGDSRKKIRIDIIDANELESEYDDDFSSQDDKNENYHQSKKLPSCVHLLRLSSESEDATYLYSLFDTKPTNYRDINELNIFGHIPLNLPAPRAIYK